MEPTTSDKKAPSVIAFVHAKGVSERLPGKNLRVLGDRPLVCHAIRNALAAEKVDLVVIDSDSDEILKVGEEAGAVPWKRPPGLATNKTTGDDLAYWQSLLYPESQILVQVVPTCPFTLPASITYAVTKVEQNKMSAVGVRTTPLYEWHNGKPTYCERGKTPTSQDVSLVTSETTGLYAFSRWVAASRHRGFEDECAFIQQSPIEAINIDTEEDWRLAELVWKGMQVEHQQDNWDARVKSFLNKYGRTPREGELC